MASWHDLRPIFDSSAARNGWIADDRSFGVGQNIGEDFLPSRAAIFRALEEINPSEVRFLILGQDPYPDLDPTGIAHATGIAFAIDEKCQKIPPSLKRIMSAIYVDGHGRKDLRDWRTQHGVLLLNVAFTVPALSKGITARDVAGDHLPFWKKFTTGLVAQVRQASPMAQLIAWGSDARDVVCDALEVSGAFISANHPATYAGDERSFAAFWDTPVGHQLRGL